jgi:hypothetical protein
MTTIVFSKDRAMQLQAFLRSYQCHVRPLGMVHVLYLATTERHAHAYAEVFEQFPFLITVPQCEPFRTTLLSLLPKGDGSVLFFVDDQIFIRPWTVLEEAGLSLRLGLNLTQDYAFNDALQTLPPYEELPDGRIRWCWANGELSWGYPLSIDGHVFDAAQIKSMAGAIEFRSPNTLESELQRFNYAFYPRYGTCYRESKVVGVPWNVVQGDWINRHMASVDTGSDAMLNYWETGKQIHLSHIDGVLNASVHQEFPLMLEDR